MSRPPRFDAATVAAVVADAIGTRVVRVEHHAVGWGNENWRITTTDGDRFIAKFGPPDSWPKWSATHGVYEAAAMVGVPVPTLVHAHASHPDVDGWVVRVFTWIDAIGADTVLTGADASTVSTFFEALGAVLARLHTLPAAGFGSRLDGSKPLFDSWASYIEWRFPAIDERARAAGAYAPGELESYRDLLFDLAAAVAPACQAVVCHRDVYLDNVLVHGDGSIAALIDFDGAEPWDAASDTSKLRWLVFPEFAGSERAWRRGYFGESNAPADWERRVVVAELLELMNAVPNAVATGAADFEASARRRLAEVVDSARAL